jgi:hypothetical protein
VRYVAIDPLPSPNATYAGLVQYRVPVTAVELLLPRISLLDLSFDVLVGPDLLPFSLNAQTISIFSFTGLSLCYCFFNSNSSYYLFIYFIIIIMAI